MLYCPKCGNKVDETMIFCPNCGASLKAETTKPPAPTPTYHRNEKGEKQEKNQRNEKGEKQEKNQRNEKGEFGFISWLIGGVVIIVIGIFAYARAVGYVTSPIENAIVLVVVGVALILVAIWMSMRARSRNPAPPS